SKVTVEGSSSGELTSSGVLTDPSSIHARGNTVRAARTTPMPSSTQRCLPRGLRDRSGAVVDRSRPASVGGRLPGEVGASVVMGEATSSGHEKHHRGDQQQEGHQYGTDRGRVAQVAEQERLLVDVEDQ